MLLTLRFVQAAWNIWTGETELMIASHEAEDLVEEQTRKSMRED
jgi:hypothetical protein